MFLWYIFVEILPMGEPLIALAMFALAFGFFMWTVLETSELVSSFQGGDGDD